MSRRRTTAPPPEKEPTVPMSPPSEAAFTARAASLTCLVCESGKNNARRAEELVGGLGFKVLSVEDATAAQKEMERAPVAIVLAGLPGAEPLARTVASLGTTRPALVVGVTGETQAGLEALSGLGADAFALRPYRRDGVAMALVAAVGVLDERSRAATVERELAVERERLLRHGDADPQSGFYHFEFFKKVLVLELKRARRHGYSLAACLVALDECPPAVRSPLLQQTAAALRERIRDIDLPVDYGGGNFLVFLPYTDLVGAERVGRRLEAGVRACDGVDGVSPTVSVGIAAIKPGKTVSFARLVRDAQLALRAAQLKGGGQVVVKP